MSERVPAVTYKPQRNDADNVHEDMPTIPEDSCVQRYERLCAAKREQRIGVRLEHSRISILEVTDSTLEGVPG